MKKVTLLLLAAGWIGVFTPVQSQSIPPAPRHTVAVHLGLNLIQLNDQNASPLTYLGRPFKGSLSYQRNAPKARWQAGMEVSYGPFDAKAYPGRTIHYSEEVAVPLAGNLAIGHAFVNYLQRIHSSARSTVLLGTGLQYTLHYPFEAPFAGLSAIASLPLILRAEHRFSPRIRLESQLQYALLGAVTRMPWHNTLSLPEVGSQFNAFYRNNTRLEAGLRLQQLAWQVDLRHSLGRHLNVGLRYQLATTHYPAPRPLAILSNSVQVSSSIDF